MPESGTGVLIRPNPVEQPVNPEVSPPLNHTPLNLDYLKRRFSEGRTETTERARKRLLTDRSFDQYENILGFTDEDLGTQVLDLGSGLTEGFSREASLRGKRVVSVSPALSRSEVRKAKTKLLSEIPNRDEKSGDSVAAVAQELPFKDHSFDSIVSLYAIPMYVSVDDYHIVISELQRVLKPNGKAFFAPTGGFEREFLEPVLKRQGVSYETKEIPEGLIPGKQKSYVLTINGSAKNSAANVGSNPV